MDGQQMLDELYVDYRGVCTEQEGHLTALRGKLSALDEAKRRLSELETDIEVHRHSVIVAEMYDEGRINGSNAAKRKRQTKMLLADLPQLDPDYHAMLTAVEEMRLRVDDLDLDIQILHKRISALRNQARMLSGPSFALGGQPQPHRQATI